MQNPKAYLEQIKNFDAYDLSEKQVSLLQEYKNDPDLEPANVEQKCKAAAPLAHWIKSLQDIVALKEDLKRIDAAEKRSRFNKAKSLFPDGAKQSTEHMGVPLRRIDSEGYQGEEGQTSMAASTKRGRKGSASGSYL